MHRAGFAVVPLATHERLDYGITVTLTLIAYKHTPLGGRSGMPQ